MCSGGGTRCHQGHADRPAANDSAVQYHRPQGHTALSAQILHIYHTFMDDSIPQHMLGVCAHANL